MVGASWVAQNPAFYMGLFVFNPFGITNQNFVYEALVLDWEIINLSFFIMKIDVLKLRLKLIYSACINSLGDIPVNFLKARLKVALELNPHS